MNDELFKDKLGLSSLEERIDLGTLLEGVDLGALKDPRVDEALKSLVGNNASNQWYEVAMIVVAMVGILGCLVFGWAIT